MKCNAPTDPGTGLALEPESVSEASYVAYCQNEIGDDDDYCSVCGAKVIRGKPSDGQVSLSHKRTKSLPTWVIVVAIVIFALQYVLRFAQAELKDRQAEQREQRQKMNREMSEIQDKIQERLRQQWNNWEK